MLSSTLNDVRVDDSIRCPRNEHMNLCVLDDGACVFVVVVFCTSTRPAALLRSSWKLYPTPEEVRSNHKTRVGNQVGKTKHDD